MRCPLPSPACLLSSSHVDGEKQRSLTTCQYPGAPVPCQPWASKHTASLPSTVRGSVCSQPSLSLTQRLVPKETLFSPLHKWRYLPNPFPNQTVGNQAPKGEGLTQPGKEKSQSSAPPCTVPAAA